MIGPGFGQVCWRVAQAGRVTVRFCNRRSRRTGYPGGHGETGTGQFNANAAASGGTVTLEINSGGSKLDGPLGERLRKAVRVRAGDVQIVSGGAGSRRNAPWSRKCTL